MTELEKLREEIDLIDEKIALLFEKRMEAAEKIGEYKKQNRLPVTDPDREREVSEKFASRVRPEYKRSAEFLSACLINAAKGRQRQLTAPEE